MRRIIVLSLICLACNGDGDTSKDDDETTYSQQVPNGVDRPSAEPIQTYEDNLTSGEAINLAFAQEVYCFPATENDNFSGNHVFFEHSQAIGTSVTILATPERKRDISLYVIQTAADSESLPPNISGGGGTTCEVSFDQVNDDNAGQPEGLTIPGWENPYRLIIGVAGAHEATEAAFKVEIWED